MNVVLDTNVVMSGLFFGGTPLKALEIVLFGRAKGFASPSIISEYFEVFARFSSFGKKAKKKPPIYALSLFVDSLTIVEDTHSVKACRDPDDDKYLDCAVNSKANFIVSGDKDLLVLRKYRGIKIVNARTFCEDID